MATTEGSHGVRASLIRIHESKMKVRNVTVAEMEEHVLSLCKANDIGMFFIFGALHMQFIRRVRFGLRRLDPAAAMRQLCTRLVTS
jgi:hypothetical protein